MSVVEPTASDAVVPAGRAGPPEQPAISVPRKLRRSAVQSSSARQPALGLLGLTLVIPIAGVLAFGAGEEGSVLVLAPIITYALPLVVMVAFWWSNWPGSRLRASEAGWADTVLIAAGAIVLTGIGQAVAGRVDPAGLFDSSPGPGQVPTFPATMALGGTAFIAMLQLTLVGEGWPLRRMRPVPGGLLAVACSWIVAVVVYFSLVEVEPLSGSDVTARHGPVPGVELGAVLVLIGAWQVLCYVSWRGWPFAQIASAPVRRTTAHLIVLGGGILTYLIARRLLGFEASGIAALSGCFIASGLVFGMLFEDWLRRLSAPVERAALLLAIVALTAVLAVVLNAVAHAMRFPRISPEDWVEHVTLNALSTSIILHVAIGRRWPFLRQYQEVGQLT
jgi:multisubunit Na+/H+ antiporter MnhB subunit